MVVQLQEAAQLLKLIHIFHLGVNREIKFYLPKPSWMFRKKTVQNIPLRELLYGASHTNFMTERCAKRLRLSGIKTHTQIQGISSVKTQTYHSVSIHLRSRHTDWHTMLN